MHIKINYGLFDYSLFSFKSSLLFDLVGVQSHLARYLLSNDREICLFNKRKSWSQAALIVLYSYGGQSLHL